MVTIEKVRRWMQVVVKRFNSRTVAGSAFVLTIAMFGVISCQRADKPAEQKKLFTLLSPRETGVDFVNELHFTDEFNIYTYRNFYNGGGTALGDINNDGLLDIYFTSNQGDNKLFLNKGNFNFEDITLKAGVAGKGAWSTGVSLADVDGDGFLDIYVSNSGDIKGDNKQNELFINNGDLTFTERAEEFGVADRGYTTHAVFFDYDKDGDLDLYILNNSFQAIGTFNLRKNERGKRDPLGGHKLLRNDKGHFTDVSEAAGIFGSVISFGLGVAVGDLDKDGWQDIYVSNDFFERDYLYINNHNGTFRECLTEQMESVSGASMGADMGDINNDTYPDIFVTEMLPATNDRIKTVSSFDTWDRYQYNVANGYYHQFSRNMLQLNNGDGSFSEIGRLAGVEASDWSWGALIFDMDNDGLKDIFVANGIYHDLTDQDYLQFASSEEVVKAVTSGRKIDYKKLIDAMPSTKISNVAFINRGNFRFVNESAKLGLEEPGFSNGSAYGDLDNDGDLDLVVNNVNMPAFVYRNNADTMLRNNHYLKFNLVGIGDNTLALGAQVTLQHHGKKYYIEQMPIRGFESSSDPRPNFGLGAAEKIDSVSIVWPDGKISRLKNVVTNQTVTVRQSEAATERKPAIGKHKNIFETLVDKRGVDFIQHENDFVDFDQDRLIFHMLSAEGPRISIGDVNGDGRQDFYIGGPKNQAGALFVQSEEGKFSRTNEKLFEADKLSEDEGSVFFDADNDGDQDLYVASGGREYPVNSPAYSDRLYINNGKGMLTKALNALPYAEFESNSVVCAADYDLDGDVDLFVGGRMEIEWYGAPAHCSILNNDGKGNFSNVATAIAPALLKIGMVIDAVWADVDDDKDVDLVIIGEYMPVKILLNDNGRFEEAPGDDGLLKSNGWWNRIQAADLDGDGDVDFVIGNHGLNSRFQASNSKPVTMVVNDFDHNGTVEQIISTWFDNEQYPLALRHDLVSQIPELRKKYLKYDQYKDQKMSDIFEQAQLKDAIVLAAYNLHTSIMLNNGNGHFELIPLPVEAQFAPVYGISIKDFDHDGIKDILIAGNFYRSKPQVGRYDASYGLFLKGKGKGKFVPLPSQESGFRIKGEVRELEVIKIKNKDFVIAGVNDGAVELIKIN